MKKLTSPQSHGHYQLAALLIAGITAGLLTLPESQAGTIRAKGRMSGKVFNKPSRQHIRANFQGKGVHRPSGKQGQVNGRLSSLSGQRTPRATLSGPYNVLARASVRRDGSSTSVSDRVKLILRKRVIRIKGIGRIKLSRPINLNKKGSQRFRGTGFVTIRDV